MKVIYLPEYDENKKFIEYEVNKNNLNFNDGDLSFNVAKKERDYEVVIDICEDYTGGLVMGANTGDKYIAQVVIPARQYTEVETEESEDSEGTGTDFLPVPFNIENCELRLWEMED